jgi:dihydrofolate reductase
MPKEIILIAAVTIDGFIARHNKEVVSWSLDLPLFKKQTIGHSIIMGSNTRKVISKELSGRKNIVVTRKDDPVLVLNNIITNRCFIIGGGITYSRFSPFITHMYVTPHPFIFGKGIRLFENFTKEINLQFKKIITVDESKGIHQYQYKVEKV